MALVNLINSYIYLETIIDFLVWTLRFIDYTDCKNIIYLFKCYMLILHLIPNGIRALHTCFKFIFKAHIIKSLTDWSGKLLKKSIALSLCRSKFLLNRGIGIRMFIAETKVFKFCFYLVQTKTIGKWRIDIKCFSSYLILFVGRL